MDLRSIIALAAAGAVATTTALVAQPATDTKPKTPTPTKPVQPEKPAEKKPAPTTPPEKQPTDAKQPGDKAPDGSGMSQEEELAWTLASMTNDNHQRLEEMLGDWDCKAKFWMDPSAPAMEMTGTSKNAFVLGGRWLRQDFTSTFMGQPFTGLGYTGYDNIKKTYIGTWMDTMTTGMMTSEGKFDEATNTYTFTGWILDPMNKKNAFRHVMKIDNENQHTFSMFESKGGEAERKTAEMVYTRKK
ncbi:MAG: DUF1579 domain-containing protein [Phycisphaerales bacterium]|nr:DUF1579 domain-containing protein [Phycisphaerales bacterium]